MKRVLVTGGSGFVGQYLVDRLVANQVEVIAAVRASTRDSNVLRQ